MGRQGFLTAAVRQEQLKGAIPENRHTPATTQRLVDSSPPEASVLAPYDGHFEPLVDCAVKLTNAQLFVSRTARSRDLRRARLDPADLVAERF